MRNLLIQSILTIPGHTILSSAWGFAFGLLVYRRNGPLHVLILAIAFRKALLKESP